MTYPLTYLLIYLLAFSAYREIRDPGSRHEPHELSR